MRFVENDNKITTIMILPPSIEITIITFMLFNYESYEYDDHSLSN